MSKIEELIAAGDDLGVNLAITHLTGSHDHLGMVLSDWLYCYGEGRDDHWMLFGTKVELGTTVESEGYFRWWMGDSSSPKYHPGAFREHLYRFVVQQALEAGIVVES